MEQRRTAVGQRGRTTKGHEENRGTSEMLARETEKEAVRG